MLAKDEEALQPFATMCRRCSQILFGISMGILLGLATGCSDPEARFQESMAEARALVDEGNHEQALEILNALTAQYPDRAEVLFAIAEAHDGSGSPFFAGLFYEQAAEADPNFSESLYRAAQLFAAEGDEVKALNAVNRYLELFPDDAAAWRFSADLLANENRIQSALSAHLRAERQDGPSRNPEYAAEMGRLYLLAGNPAQAEVYFQTGADESPEDRLTALIGLLTLAYRAEDFERSEELIQLLDEEFPGALEASAMAPAREQVRLWRVTQDAIAEELARIEAEEARRKAEAEAAEAEQAALESDGGNEEAVEEGGIVEEGDPEPGQSVGKMTAIETEEADPVPAPPPPPPPPPPPTDIELAEAAMEAGEPAEATRLYWKAVANDGDNPDAWAGLSRASLAAGDPETAEIAILEARRRDPDNLRFTLTYLDVIQQSRSRARFMEELERTYERIPNSPDVVLSMARAYAQPGGNPANAAYFYRQFLEMSPNHPEVVAARRELNALP